MMTNEMEHIETIEYPQLVTVVLPTFKRIQSLAKAIDSVISQNYSNIELIIVDDSCSEFWYERNRMLISRHPKTKYIVNEGIHGSSAARNLGIDNAEGEYIAFLDDDDEYLPNKILEQLESMKKNKADLSLTDMYIVNENNRIIETRRHRDIRVNCPKELLKYHLVNHLTGTSTIMFRTSFLKELGGFGAQDLGDEFYLVLKAIENNGRVCYLERPLTRSSSPRSTRGLSYGNKKIENERDLYIRKQSYFNLLSPKEIRKVKVRHFATLAYAYFQSKMYIDSVIEAFKAFILDPISFFKLASKYISFRLLKN